MIVRDTGDGWQVVLQTDHADLSAAFARQWAEQTPRFESLVVATERHDDGWSVWEQAPAVDGESGKPLNFLDVQIRAHLAFYRACITAVTDQDAYAGLLVSMHGAGIYRQRYGTQTSLKLTHVEGAWDDVEAFVAEQEGRYEERMHATGVSDDERWHHYRLLQIYDRLSLYFCLKDLDRGEADEINDLHIEPAGPWRVRIDPYPFRESPARFTLLRRVLPKRAWTDGEFQREFFALEPERTEIVAERA
jgi:hypothetical protein